MRDCLGKYSVSVKTRISKIYISCVCIIAILLLEDISVAILVEQSTSKNLILTSAVSASC